jgi:hypothetical protein
VEHVAGLKEMINVYKILFGKPEGKKSLGRPRCRLVDHITLYLKEIGCEGVNWIKLAEDIVQW